MGMWLFINTLSRGWFTQSLFVEGTGVQLTRHKPSVCWTKLACIFSLKRSALEHNGLQQPTGTFCDK